MSNRVLATLVILLTWQPALAMDLMDLYREAKANDAKYAAARAQFRVMQEAVPQAKAGLAPRVRLGANDQTFRANVNAGLSSSGTHQSHYNARNGIRARTGQSYKSQPGWPH